MHAESSASRAESELSVRISAAAQAAHLGRHQATYPVGMPSWTKLWGSALATAFFVAVAIAGVLTGEAGIAVIIGGFVALPLTLRLLLVVAQGMRHQSKYRGARLDLYQHGLIQVQHDRVRTVRYDTTTMFQVLDHYYLTDTVGQRVELTKAFSDQQLWVRAIEEAVVSARLAPALAALEAGQRVEFGKIWVSAAEVGDEKSSAPWTQVDDIGARASVVGIGVKGKRIRPYYQAMSEFPNLCVFYALAERLRRST